MGVDGSKVKKGRSSSGGKSCGLSRFIGREWQKAFEYFKKWY